MRIQLALNVRDIDEAVDFYSKLFDVKVNKRKPGYANFSIDQPPLKLVLFENPGAAERLNHLGVEVFEQAVQNATPTVEVKPRRVGGATYQVPVDIRAERRLALALRWLLASARARRGRSMAERLAAELSDAASGQGSTVKKKEETAVMTR